MTHLYLIRHGQSTAQANQIFKDEGLTHLGVTQAERLRDRLQSTGEIAADVLIASTYPRARQTAEIIAPALGLPIIFDDEVQEMRVGEAEGLNAEEYRERYGDHLDDEPFRPVSPGGEYWGQFVLRVSTALERITREHAGKSIVVVCHGGVIDSSFLYFFNMPILTLPQARFYTRNTSITHWHKVTPEIGPVHWRLESYNDSFHLRDLNKEQRIPWERLSLTNGSREPSVAPTEQ